MYINSIHFSFNFRSRSASTYSKLSSFEVTNYLGFLVRQSFVMCTLQSYPTKLIKSKTHTSVTFFFCIKKAFFKLKLKHFNCYILWLLVLFFKYLNVLFIQKSVQASFDSLHIDSSEGGHSPGRPTHRRYHSGGSFKFLPPPDLPESPPRGVVPTRKAEASRYISHHQPWPFFGHISPTVSVAVNSYSGTLLFS